VPFHNVHHIDADPDVSTAFRFHFGEIILSIGFSLLQVSLIGPSVWAFALYQLVFQAEVLLRHSNVRIPLGAERLLNHVLVTPRMHGIHHYIAKSSTSNRPVVFPIPKAGSVPNYLWPSTFMIEGCHLFSS
jgi:sterol desaturase/sphingolipid hydroxylase (fatty acid hydroxylase superfamily)